MFIVGFWDCRSHHSSAQTMYSGSYRIYEDVIKWTNFPRYWPFVRGIRRSLVNSPHKAIDAELWCFLWSAPEQTVMQKNREACDLRRHRTHYDVTVMLAETTGCRPVAYFRNSNVKDARANRCGPKKCVIYEFKLYIPFFFIKFDRVINRMHRLPPKHSLQDDICVAKILLTRILTVKNNQGNVVYYTKEANAN